MIEILKVCLLIMITIWVITSVAVILVIVKVIEYIIVNMRIIGNKIAQ